MKIAQRFIAGNQLKRERSPRSGRLIDVGIISRPFHGLLRHILSDPTDESVGYYHWSAEADFLGSLPGVNDGLAAHFEIPMAKTLESGCRVSEIREGDPLIAGTLCIWNRIGRATGAQAISLRILEFAPGLSPGIRNGDSDEILYVLEGDSLVDLSAQLLIDGRSYEISGDTGIYIRPGETFALNNPGSHSVIIASSQCPDPDLPPQFVEAMTSPKDDSQASVPIVRLSDRPPQPTADRWYRVIVDDEIGSSKATQFVGSIPPGRAPDHFHQYEEVLLILKGEGRMWAGETNTPIAPGSCIYLPKGQVHCVENTGAGELRLLGVFYPAGSPSVRYET